MALRFLTAFKSQLIFSLCVILLISSYYALQANAQNGVKSIGSEMFTVMPDKDVIKLKLDQNEEINKRLSSIESNLANYKKEAHLVKEKRYTLKANIGAETNSLVFYPISGGVEKDSKYYLIINSAGQIVSEVLLLGIKDEKGLIRSIVNQNGSVIFDTLMTEKGEIQAGFAITSDGVKHEYSNTMLTPKGFWSCFNNCLASQGIAAWAVTTISILCAVSCAATFGVGCAVCLGGITVVSGSVVGYCSGTCSSNPEAY
jgi:hypothetical protein